MTSIKQLNYLFMQKTITIKNIPNDVSKEFNQQLKEYRYKVDDKITELEFLVLIIKKGLQNEKSK